MSNEKLNKLVEMLGKYHKDAETRRSQYGLNPKPLIEDEVKILADALIIMKCRGEVTSPLRKELSDEVLYLITTQVRRGSFPETEIKAEILGKIALGKEKSDILSPIETLELLGDMKGGAATIWLINCLSSDDKNISIKAKEYLSKTIFVSKEEVSIVADLLRNEKIADMAESLLRDWAEEKWKEDWKLPSIFEGIAIKVGDSISTDHLSPAKRASTRTDLPLHSKYIMEGRPDEANFQDRLLKLKSMGKSVFLIGGERFGEGSSRKSATYNVLQVLGESIEGEPDIKKGGVVVAKSIAPIFENSLIASGILAIQCDTSNIKEGDSIKIDIKDCKIFANNQEVASFKPLSEFVKSKLAAGGMNNYASAKYLATQAREACAKNGIKFKKVQIDAVKEKKEVLRPQTLAQKIVGRNRLDGKNTILPNETAEIKVNGVYSQDTTGPMTYMEYQAIVGGRKFGADYVLQSLCHTCESPTAEDCNTQNYLCEFAVKHGGTCFKPGEGVLHTLSNRFVLPDEVVFGGDSHTRTERGISFPAGSDIVATAMKFGSLEITMDESVLVKFKGKMNAGISARDIVSAIVVYSEKLGLGKGIFNGRILEMEGVENFSCEDRYVLTNASAERSAPAATIPPDEKTIAEIKEDFEYLKWRYNFEKSEQLKRRLERFENWLSKKELLSRDIDAKYSATIEIPLKEIKQPYVAKPHHPDNVATLDEVGGTKVTDVYIGSCVGGHYESLKSAAKILKGKKVRTDINFYVSPASQQILSRIAQEGYLSDLINAGAYITLPCCGLCMGNKRQLPNDAIAITTTTRNFQSRLGPPSVQAYLGSSEVAAITAILGHLPSAKEYFDNYKS